MKVDTTKLASAAEMLGWIEEIVAQGIRRPAYSADEWTERFVRDQFRAAGLERVRFEPVTLPRWEPRSARVTVWPADRPAETIELSCFPLPHSAARTIEAELVPLDATGRALDGCVALDRIELLRMPQAVMRSLATRHHDPDGDFDELVQVLPFSAAFQEVMEPALTAGAAAYLGVLAGVPWDTHDYYVPYDGIARPVPGAWISGADGHRVDALVAAGRVMARIEVEADRTEVESHNVVGELPGPSDEWVVVGTHHDGPWASAVEDASGIALLLAQARYWAAVPAAERPHNLLFTAMAGHMVAGAGTRAFIEQHRDLLDRIVLELHLEHTARMCEADGTSLVPTDDPEPRWWFTTQNPALEDAVEAALVAEDLRRSLILRPDVFGPIPTTDGGFFHAEGVPLVNFLTAPMYLFDSADTLDKVHVPSLEPVSRAAVRLIEWTGGRTAAGNRTGVAK